MKLKTHHHLIIISLLALGIFSIWTLGHKALAVDSTISVTIGIDVCPNIPGFQTTMPSGMQLDSNGNCYTPAPSIDVCANLAGNQQTIPNGYYRDDNSGNCYIQPAPPIDVCTNLPGVQTIVPLGYTNKADGDCVPIPKDMCSNIDGLQTTIPQDMVRDNQGVCVTPDLPPVAPDEPETPTNPWVAPTKPREPTKPDKNGRLESATSYKNVPTIFNPVVEPLVNLVPESVKTTLRSLPPVIAQTFPYYVFAVLGAGAIGMWLQALREVSASRLLFTLLKREKSIAEEKDNFIALASHYLRTPLTLMTSGLDTIKALKELPEEQIEILRSPILVLDGEIKSILSEIESNQELQAIEAPLANTKDPNFLRSGFFWWPIIVSIAITLLANFFLGVVGEVEIGTLNLWFQVLVFFMVAFFFYTAIRNRYIRQENRVQHEQLITHERTIDRARNAFIERATAALQTGLTSLFALRPNLNGAHSVKFFDDGFERFQAILVKFTLLSQIRAGSEAREEIFDLKTAVDNAIARYLPQADEKQLTIVNNTKPMDITQRRTLFEFVLGSVLDNAIKFSHTGGTIQLAATPKEHKITIKVSDYGVGIDKDKLSQLFKPFSRADSALEFNYEGLGFSLFLDKIIMDHINGTIEADSEVDKGATFTITATTKPASGVPEISPPLPTA